MQERTSAAIGFLVAPVLAAAIGAFLTPISGDRINSNPVSVLRLTIAFYPFALFATLLIAVPAFLLLRKFSLVRLWSAVLTGVMVGVISLAVFSNAEVAPLV